MRLVISSVAIAILVLSTAILLQNPAYSDEDKAASESKSAEKGEAVFKEKGCTACHTIGGGKLSGPDLAGVTERREEEWLKEWIKSPDKMIMTDPIAKEMLKEYFVPMPNQGLTDEEVDEIIVYLKYEDSKNKKSD